MYYFVKNRALTFFYHLIKYKFKPPPPYPPVRPSVRLLLISTVISPPPTPIQIRLAHRYAKGEDPDLSLPATVDLSQLVLEHTLVSAEEISLTGGSSLAARTQKLKWTATATATAATATANYRTTATPTTPLGPRGLLNPRAKISVSAGGLTSVGQAFRVQGEDDVGTSRGLEGGSLPWAVSIEPMEIRTFRLELVRDRPSEAA